jgi:hypothetical protein
MRYASTNKMASRTLPCVIAVMPAINTIRPAKLCRTPLRRNRRNRIISHSSQKIVPRKVYRRPVPGPIRSPVTVLSHQGIWWFMGAWSWACRSRSAASCCRSRPGALRARTALRPRSAVRAGPVGSSDMCCVLPFCRLEQVGSKVQPEFPLNGGVRAFIVPNDGQHHREARHHALVPIPFPGRGGAVSHEAHRLYQVRSTRHQRPSLNAAKLRSGGRTAPLPSVME